MLQHRPSQASSSNSRRRKRRMRWRKKESNYLTFDNNQFMMKWPYQSWTLSLPLLSSMHSLIVDWLFMQIFLTSLVLFFFFIISFCCCCCCCLTNKHLPEKLNVVHVIYVIGQSIDIYFILFLRVPGSLFCVCHLSSSFCTFALPFSLPTDGDWMKNQKELLLVSIFIHYENRIIKMQHQDSFYARNADLCSEAKGITLMMQKCKGRISSKFSH